jgi:uroporphyrin-III C-methyltransferase
MSDDKKHPEHGEDHQDHSDDQAHDEENNKDWRQDEMPSQQPQANKGARLLKGLIWLAVAIIIIVIIVALIRWHQSLSTNKQTEATNHQQFSQFDSRMDKLEQDNNNLHQQLTSLRQTSTQQGQDIAFTKATSSRLQDELGGKQMGWLLDEALYLTRLARYNLSYQHDINTSKILLEDADQALFLTGYPEVAGVRKILAENAAALQAIPPLDVTGIFLKLQALNNQISKLPLISDNPAAEKLATNDKKETSADSSWKDSLNKNIHRIGKLIVIQRRDKPIQPLISPEQQTLLDLYLSNLFNNAQWALLHRNNAIYQSSLGQINQAISTYYATDSDSTQQLLTSVHSLAEVDVAPKLPNIDATLRALINLSDQIAANASNKKKALPNNKPEEAQQ